MPTPGSLPNISGRRRRPRRAARNRLPERSTGIDPASAGSSGPSAREHQRRNTDMNMRQLQYFLPVAAELNFTRASERVNIAQPALSAQIIALEDELGTPLFTREKRKVLLTPAGEILVEHAQRVLNTASAAIAAVRASGRGAR